VSEEGVCGKLPLHLNKEGFMDIFEYSKTDPAIREVLVSIKSQGRKTMTNIQLTKTAVAARAFISAVEKTILRRQADFMKKKICRTTKEEAECRRASMDLSRSLADMRKPVKKVRP
jgi:hypothetical protein